MTISTSTERYFILSTYTHSLWKRKPVEFASLLSTKVSLVHYTNDVKDHEASGCEDVLNLFIKKFFSSLVSIDIQSINYNTSGSEPEYKLISIQEMEQDGKVQRIKYQDHTTFELEIEGGVLRISKVVMNVTKEVLGQ